MGAAGTDVTRACRYDKPLQRVPKGDLPMRRSRTIIRFLFTIMILLSVLPAAAEETNTPTYGADRLFMNFAEDATIIDGQWWEGQFVWADGDAPYTIDSMVLRVVAAVNLRPHLEVGGSVGFGDTDADGGVDGSGATDLDLYGKWHFGATKHGSELAAGGIVTIPTGDDTAGLGYDAFSFAGFGSLRHRFEHFVLTGNIGARANGDGGFRGADLDGDLSGFGGAGIIYPISDQVSLIGEMDFESSRFDGGKSMFDVSGGLNWHLSNRGIARVAISFGLADGSPDSTLTGGYVFLF
jgi:hypothetical protein